MLQIQIEQNLTTIEQCISNGAQPLKIISLFYTTIKHIQKEHSQSQKNSFLNTICNSFPISPLCPFNHTKRSSSKIQQLFSNFMQKNKKSNIQLDKVNGHMLKLTSEMIVGLNEKKMQAIYRNSSQSQQAQREIYLNNRFQRTRSLSQANLFQFNFNRNFTQVNSNSNRDQQSVFDVEKLKNKFIAQNDRQNKFTPKNSRISQKTNESVSSIQGQQNNSNKSLSSGLASQKMQKVFNYYSQHKIDQAFESLKKVQSGYPNEIQSLPQNEKQLINQIKKQHQQMKYFYKYFDLTGYKMDKKQDNITMHYKVMDKQNLVAIQVQSQVDISIEKFICIASEIQLYDKYVPFNYETKCLRQPARNKKIGRSKVFIPLLNNRQAYFQAKAYDRLNSENCIFIFSKNLKKSDLNLLGIQYKSQGLIDLDYIFFLLSYTPLTKQTGRIRMATCIDLKINILPKFILNKTARLFAFDYFKNMININKKFVGSAWQRQIKNKPQHYGFFGQKIGQYFEGKQGKNSN